MKERSAAKAIGEQGPPLSRGLLLASSSFLLATTTSLVHHQVLILYCAGTQLIFVLQFFWRSIMTGVLARTALISSMYSRAVGFSAKSRSKLSNATILNYISTDVSRIEAAAQWFHPVWSAPIQVAICLTILLFHVRSVYSRCLMSAKLQQLGPSALAGFALFILIIPLQKRILGRQFRIRKRLARLTELRTKSLLEVLSSMHFVKCYTLETSFLRRRRPSSLCKPQANTRFRYLGHPRRRIVRSQRDPERPVGKRRASVLAACPLSHPLLHFVFSIWRFRPGGHVRVSQSLPGTVYSGNISH